MSIIGRSKEGAETDGPSAAAGKRKKVRKTTKSGRT